jgi:hypothetical protein
VGFSFKEDTVLLRSTLTLFLVFSWECDSADDDDAAAP